MKWCDNIFGNKSFARSYFKGTKELLTNENEDPNRKTYGTIAQHHYFNLSALSVTFLLFFIFQFFINFQKK